MRGTKKIIWRLYLLVKEMLQTEETEEDIEKCAYLFHYLCTEIIFYHSLHGNLAIAETTQRSIADSVNNILLKTTLEHSKIEELALIFNEKLE